MRDETALDKIGDRVVVASVSGGKDSTAMALYLRELGIPFRAVFMDTGWEHPLVYDYVYNVLPEHIGPIEIIAADPGVTEKTRPHVERIETMLGRPSAMVRCILRKGMFPSRVRRFCTKELKVFTMAGYLDGLDAEPVNAVGVRAEESAARARLPEWEEWSAGDCEVWRPLLRWSGDDVVGIHTRHSVPPNPLYLQGVSRVGCWPCIFARKAEVRLIADVDPRRIAVVEALEQAVAELARDRATSKGKEHGRAPTWFQSPLRNREGARPCWPIRKVVTWSRTRRGGRQMEMFAPPASEWGCMRWGVCDTGAAP